MKDPVKDPEIKLFGKKICLMDNGDDVIHAGEEFSGDSGGSNDIKGTSCELLSEVEESRTEKENEDEKIGLTEENCKSLPEENNQDEVVEESQTIEVISVCEDSPDSTSMDEGENDTDNSQQKALKKPDKILPCPRCNSMDTKFCYYNNYNVNQPRHFCKSCRRYWTVEGTMRNVPVGAGRRKTSAASGSGATEAIDLDADEVEVAANSTEEIAAGGERQAGGVQQRTRVASPSGQSAPPSILFNKEFMAKPDVPGWEQQVRSALTAVPPIPVMIKSWTPTARQAVGDGLAKRVAADVRYSDKIDTAKCVSDAIGEFGLAIHTISTCLHSTLEGAKQAAAREAKLQTDIDNARAAFKKSLSENQVKWDKLAKEFEDKIREAKDYSAALEEKSGTAEEKASADAKARKEAEEALKLVRIEFKATLKAAEEKAKAAEETARVAEEKAAEAAAGTESSRKQLATCLEDYKNSEEFWDLLGESYDQGAYHMARCFRRASDQGKSPSLEDLASYVLKDPFCEELVGYHSVLPFKKEEIAKFNELRRNAKKPEVVFPRVVSDNLRVAQAKLEQERKEKTKADRAQQADAAQSSEAAKKSADKPSKP